MFFLREWAKKSFANAREKRYPGLPAIESPSVNDATKSPPIHEDHESRKRPACPQPGRIKPEIG
jgi:hypothetical protein